MPARGASSAASHGRRAGRAVGPHEPGAVRNVGKRPKTSSRAGPVRADLHIWPGWKLSIGIPFAVTI